MKEGTDKSGIIGESVDFFRGAWEELKKVHTPTRQETIQATIVVVAMVFLMAMFLGGTDFIIHKLMQKILVS